MYSFSHHYGLSRFLSTLLLFVVFACVFLKNRMAYRNMLSKSATTGDTFHVHFCISGISLKCTFYYLFPEFSVILGLFNHLLDCLSYDTCKLKMLVTRRTVFPFNVTSL